MDALDGPRLGVEQAAPSSGRSSAHRPDEEPSRYQPLVIVVSAMAAGIVCDRYAVAIDSASLPFDLSWFYWWWLLAAAALIAWRIAWRRQFNALALGPLLFAAACAGAAWHHAQWKLFGEYDISRYANVDLSPVCVEAIARETPQSVPAPQPTPLRAIPGSERSRLQVALVGIRNGTLWHSASGDCELVVEGQLLSVRPGDRVRIFGQFYRISPPLNPGEFDFAQHARADGKLVRMRSSAPECITVVASANRWRVDWVGDAVRNGAKRLVRRFVAPDRAELACAILLGAREGLTPDELEPYLLTGTVHVLVVSGMNVAILAFGLYALMRVGWLSRRTGLAIVMAVVTGYALIAEAQPPVIRAAVFAVLVCVGAWRGRSGVAFNSLAFAALVVLMLNPSDLFRSGPQLSFLAVGALVWIESRFAARRAQPVDPLDRLLAEAQPWPWRALIGVRGWVGRLLIASLVVWFVTLPLLLNQFHVASPVAVLISPLLWVVVFVAMWTGFFMLAVGWLAPPIGAWCGVACGSSLGALESLVSWAEQLPGGHFFAPGPAGWWVLVFYFAVLAGVVFNRAWLPRRWQVAALCAWIAVGLLPPLLRGTQRDALECSFVAVGHGACVVLESPSGETLLYDAGSLSSPEFATQTIASYLWHRGVMRIDGIVISHADIDHYNAVPGLLERFAVGTVYVSPMMFDGIDDSNTRGPQVLLEAIRAADVPVREVWSGDRLRMGSETVLHVIHPPRQGLPGSDNANSITLQVEHRGSRMVLPGDLESPGLEDVTAELPYDCDILLAPHHGSRRSDPPGFAAWSMPNWVVISGGGRDDVRPVVQTYERAGANVLMTSRSGAIQFSLSDGPIKIATWFAKPRN